VSQPKAGSSSPELSDAELSDAELSDAEPSDAEPSDAELSDAELSDAELSDAELSDSELPGYVQAVLDLVDQIPVGRVLSYGDIAELLDRGGPRQVGAVMSRYGSAVSWWRVIRASGDLPRRLQREAMAHWRTEGTPMTPGAAVVAGAIPTVRVDMTRARWDGADGSPCSGGHPDTVQRR
jgi:alkylated DNA nucleotide flippase Atl1